MKQERFYQKDYYPFAPNDTGPKAYFDKGWRVVIKERNVDGCNHYWWSPKFETRAGAEQFDLTRHRLKLAGLI